MKILGLSLDNKLNWNTHVQRTISKCNSFLFPLRYIRKHLSVKNTIRVFKAQFVSVLTYGCPVWSGSINFNQRAKIRSVYYSAVRIILRDFNFKLNRIMMQKRAQVEPIDNILFKRTSGLIFGIYNCLEPTQLAGKLMSRAYTNDRHPGRVDFFDLSRSKIGKRSPLNLVKTYTDNWSFEWTSLTPTSFKEKLREQFQNVNF